MDELMKQLTSSSKHNLQLAAYAAFCSEMTGTDDLMYHSYRAQRQLFPDIAPERWRLIFNDAGRYEVRYQQEQRRDAVVERDVDFFLGVGNETNRA